VLTLQVCGCGDGDRTHADLQDGDTGEASEVGDETCPSATVAAPASCIFGMFDCFDPVGACDYDEATKTYTFDNGAVARFSMATFEEIYVASDGTECFRQSQVELTRSTFHDSLHAGAEYAWDQTDWPCVDIVCPDASGWRIDGPALGEALGWAPSTICTPD